MRKYILILLLSVVGLSCKKERVLPVANNTVTVADSELNGDSKASDIFHSVEIIPLETKEESLIGVVSKIIVADRIYIMDEKSMSISMFDFKGKFINKINRQGRGPQEYLSICDFTTTADGKIVILDDAQQVLCYDLSGQLLSKQKLSFSADAIEPLNDNLFVLNGSSTGPRVFVWDMEKNRAIKTYFEYNPKFSARILKPLIKYDDEVYYTHAYSSSIWKVNEKEAVVEWYIDFGKRTVKEQDIQKASSAYYSSPSNTVYMGRFAETGNDVTFSFECEDLNEYPYYVYYDKKTKMKNIITHDHYADDILFYKYPPQIVGTTDDGKFIETITAHDLLSSRSEYDVSKFSKEERLSWDKFEAILSPVRNFDNPVVIFYTLNNDHREQ